MSKSNEATDFLLTKNSKNRKKNESSIQITVNKVILIPIFVTTFRFSQHCIIISK